jgi:hypothetical protein
MFHLGDLQYMTSVIVKTVLAANFEELGSLLTPRLHLVVDYTRGGVSMITGEQFAKGYQLSIRHDRIDQDGLRSFVIDGKGNPTACIQKADRFSQKTLDKLVGQVLSGIYDDLIARLYATAMANNPRHAWPSSILPLTKDENGLHAAVVFVVNGTV